MTCYLVLGIPRSGTSCVAGILAKLGVFMGDRLLPASPMNEAGFWQDVDFEEIFDDLPEWMPESIPLPEGGARLTRLRQLIGRRCVMGTDWGAKFKYAALVLPAFVAACTCPVKLLVTERSHKQSVDSLARWSLPADQPPAEVIDRARNAIHKAVVASDLPSLAVPFDALLADPEKMVGIIAAFVNRQPVRAAVELVNPALRRYV